MTAKNYWVELERRSRDLDVSDPDYLRKYFCKTLSLDVADKTATIFEEALPAFVELQKLRLKQLECLKGIREETAVYLHKHKIESADDIRRHVGSIVRSAWPFDEDNYIDETSYEEEVSEYIEFFLQALLP